MSFDRGNPSMHRTVHTNSKQKGILGRPRDLEPVTFLLWGDGPNRYPIVPLGSCSFNWILTVKRGGGSIMMGDVYYLWKLKSLSGSNIYIYIYILDKSSQGFTWGRKFTFQHDSWGNPWNDPGTATHQKVRQRVTGKDPRIHVFQACSITPMRSVIIAKDLNACLNELLQDFPTTILWKPVGVYFFLKYSQNRWLWIIKVAPVIECKCKISM